MSDPSLTAQEKSKQWKRELQKLARQGFSYEICNEVLKASEMTGTGTGSGVEEDKEEGDDAVLDDDHDIHEEELEEENSAH
jgi:hypothetical protein